MPQRKKDESMDPKCELTFEQTLAILAQVPKSEVDEMEAERSKRVPRKKKRTRKT